MGRYFLFYCINYHCDDIIQMYHCDGREEKCMHKVTIFHGSDHIIEKPDITLGKRNNDYGQGFYCTKEKSMAKEWACKNNVDGFVNTYSLNLDSLKVLNLLDGEYHILHWMALLLKNRTFRLSSEIAMDAKAYILNHFLMDVSSYDIVIGYRADDSYFSFAEAFIQNGLPLRTLNKALRLGKLGEQIVLVSKKAFDQLQFENAEIVDKTQYYPKFIHRDVNAREQYKNEIRKSPSYKDDIFVLDILREEMQYDDERIQRIVSK